MCDATAPAAFVQALREQDIRLGGDGDAHDVEGLDVRQVGERSFVGCKDGCFAVLIDPAERGTTRRVLVVLAEWMQREGRLRAMVRWNNFPSIIGIRKLGAQLLGVDADGYFHYELTREGFRYGKAKRAAATEPAAGQRCTASDRADAAADGAAVPRA